MNSQYLHQDVSFGVIAPDKIDKVVILLHGYNGCFLELDENLPLLEYAESNNALFVTPDMDNGYYINREKYQVGHFIMKELLNNVFTTYNLQITIDLYIAGISMGGFGSLLIGSQYPSSFKKIISISGAFIAKDVAIGNPEVVGEIGDVKTFEYFERTFAPFDTLEKSTTRNPIAAIIHCREECDLPEIILICGTKDLLYKRNMEVMQKLRANHISFTWWPIDGGIHDYKCFDEGLKRVFKIIREE